jgi:hypothetical protein
MAPSHTTLLRLLGDMHQLTTRQIARYLHPDKPKWYTEQLLRLLRTRGYIQDARLHPERGAASEHYWMLCAKGARAVGVHYGKQHRRSPSPETLQYRGLQLDLISQVTDAGWTLLRPGPIRRGQPREAETPQRRQLVAAVLTVERQAIRRLLAQGVAPQVLQDPIARAQAGQVGAVVPIVVNEYVAYLPGHPELTVVLILHPPMAGRAFWTRRPQYPSHAPDRRQRESRVERYRRLAQMLPVIAVFASADVTNSLAYVFESVGLQQTVVTQIGARLMELASLSGTTSRV